VRVLIIGGTSFVGRHIAEAVIAAGHGVTFFNRGITSGELFREHGHLRGDRRVDVSTLANARGDVVIDTCGFTPDEVRECECGRALGEALRVRQQHRRARSQRCGDR